LSRRLDKSSPGWREALGPAAEFSDAGLVAAEAAAEAEADAEDSKPDDEIRVDKRMRGEFERKRGWRVDAQTLDRFKALIAKYKGTQ
jgi:tRNA pseudouridine38-40 synthase